MESNGMYTKTYRNVPKALDDIHLLTEEKKTNDFDYHHDERDIFDEETEIMLHNLNIDNVSDNSNNGHNNNEVNIIHNDDNSHSNNNNNNNETMNQDVSNDQNHNNNDEQSKLKPKKNQLSPFAPEFDVLGSSTSINPYGGDFGVQTRPVYVPPAQIPPKTQPHSTTLLKQTNGYQNEAIQYNNNHNGHKKNVKNSSTSLQISNHHQPHHLPNVISQTKYEPSSLSFHKIVTDEINGNDKSNEDVNHKNNNDNGILQNLITPSNQDYGHGKTTSIQPQVDDLRKLTYGSLSKDRSGTLSNHLGHSQVTIHPKMNQRISATTKPTQQITTSLQGATPIGSTQPYKINARNYGPPPLDAIDPKFTNSEAIRHLQKWELLESAKRWLPGEGTFITWNGFRYLIGGPIHMGMNGHIHYCYKYPVPSGDNEKNTKDNQNNDNNKHSNKDDIDTNGQIKLPPKVETVAAKIVPNTPAFAREIYILRALQGCENITELYEVIESERTLISILELAQADVFNFFVGRVAIRHGWNLDKPAIREHFARMVISNVVQGLDQMHKKDYLHCDLKSLNILLYIYSTGHSQRRGGVYIKGKLTDFGHSSYGQIRTAEKLFSNGMARVGTAGHVAPELFVENAPCSPKIDIWSLGIVMFSMLVPGRLIFGEYTNLEALKKAYDRLYKNPFSKDTPSWWSDFERLSPEARDLILWMTRYDEKERPNEQQILQHPWFQIASNNKSYHPKLKWVDMLSFSIAQE